MTAAVIAASGTVHAAGFISLLIPYLNWRVPSRFRCATFDMKSTPTPESIPAAETARIFVITYLVETATASDLWFG